MAYEVVFETEGIKLYLLCLTTTPALGCETLLHCSSFSGPPKFRSTCSLSIKVDILLS